MLYQPFPTTRLLTKHLDQSKEQLKGLIRDKSDRMYAYVMSSVVLDQDGLLQQTGSGPNFQGGYITLCTCKHRMRASLPSGEWPNKWIAGFTGLRCGRRHWLFYLARVRDAYESQSELWYSGVLPIETREAKSARSSRLGDLYEPKGELFCGTRFDPSQHHPPLAGHSHHKNACDNGWRIDIDYSRKKLKVKAKRAPSLLVGDPKFSFLWPKRLLYVSGSWRHRIWDTLGQFLDDLNEGR